MGEEQEGEAGQEVGTVVKAGAPEVISGWHGGRIGPSGSLVDIVVVVAIAKAIAIGEE